MGPINLTTGGINQPILSENPFPEPLEKKNGGFDEPKMTYMKPPSSIETEGLVGIPVEDPVRDDELGLMVNSGLNFAAPPMPRFE